MEHIIKPYTEERPWGKFIKFTENTNSSVKIITVKENQELSLQYHHNRDEFWFIISGKGLATIGEEKKEIKSSECYSIPKNTNHRIKALDGDLTFLEISTGTFDENDIVRLEDHYGRT